MLLPLRAPQSCPAKQPALFGLSKRQRYEYYMPKQGTKNSAMRHIPADSMKIQFPWQLRLPCWHSTLGRIALVNTSVKKAGQINPNCASLSVELPERGMSQCGYFSFQAREMTCKASTWRLECSSVLGNIL